MSRDASNIYITGFGSSTVTLQTESLLLAMPVPAPAAPCCWAGRAHGEPSPPGLIAPPNCGRDHYLHQSACKGSKFKSRQHSPQNRLLFLRIG
jgi:hypothetical protein